MTGLLDPETPLAAAVLHRARPEHVTDVLVAGRRVKQAGRLTGPDPAAIRQGVADAMAAAPTEAEAARRRAVHDLAPFLRRFYAGWPEPPAPFNLLP